MSARLAFLEERIAIQRLHAEIWWGGWVTLYTGGAFYQGINALEEKDPATRADLWISALKATGGAFRYVLQPYGGIRGLDPIPGESDALRLRRAETILEHNARMTEPGSVWYAHAANIFINSLGAVIISLGWHDPAQGWQSAAIGTVVGEIALITAPWEADGDLEEYRTRFDASEATTARSPRAPRGWFVAPQAGGVAIGGVF
jgi:hypothetical protein